MTGLYDYLDQLPHYAQKIKKIRELIIANILLIGQIPSPTFREKRRISTFLDRLAELRVDECSTDGYRNPIGIIQGTRPSLPPIFVVAHLDTPFDEDVDHYYTVRENTISGAGILDNSVGVGVLLSLPEILRRLHIRFHSSIVLAGVIQSMGRGNLRGIRHLLKTWNGPIRGAVCLEGGELGRLSYYAEGMTRCELVCDIFGRADVQYKFKPNAILILNEVINQLLTLRLPQRPRSRIIIGTISGGHKHGIIAEKATLGFEIQSDSDEMVESIFSDVQDIVSGIRHEYRVTLELKTLSFIKGASLGYQHPLVKSAVSCMKKLLIEPISGASESELSIFLSHSIPALTLGLTHGENYYQENAVIEVEPLFKGVSQIIGVLQAIDEGICDEA